MTGQPSGGTSPLTAPSIRWMTAFLDLPPEGFTAASQFWAGVTGTQLSPSRGDHDEFATLIPPDGDACLRVQRLEQGPAGCHLDLHVDLTDASPDGVRAHAAACGARVLTQQDGLTVLTSPGGLPFCVVPWDGESQVPGAVTIETGGTTSGTSRADQVCLDIPPDEYERECAFWSALTGWPVDDVDVPEFRRLRRGDGVAIQVLLQRLDRAAPGQRVTAHLDLACTDADSLARQHLSAGATLVQAFPGWITLRDPAGLVYCLTRRQPWS